MCKRRRCFLQLMGSGRARAVFGGGGGRRRRRECGALSIDRSSRGQKMNEEGEGVLRGVGCCSCVCLARRRHRPVCAQGVSLPFFFRRPGEPRQQKKTAGRSVGAGFGGVKGSATTMRRVCVCVSTCVSCGACAEKTSCVGGGGGRGARARKGSSHGKNLRERIRVNRRRVGGGRWRRGGARRERAGEARAALSLFSLSSVSSPPPPAGW